MNLHLDFETRSACDLKKCGVDIYALHPTTDILCIAYAFGEEKVQSCLPKDLPVRVKEHVASGGKVTAHNSYFEISIWNGVGVRKYGWPPLKIEQTYCTMAQALAMSLPSGLASAAGATGLTHQKDAEGHRLMLQLSQPRDVSADGSPIWWNDLDKLIRLIDYCMTDVEVERELEKRIFGLSESERKVFMLDYKINKRGVQVDLPAIKAAIKLIDKERDRLDKKIRKLTNDAVGTYRAVSQIKDWMEIHGVKVESVAKAAVLDALSTDLPPSLFALNVGSSNCISPFIGSSP
jgi:DNA polymerase